jgi:hypothetical protein
MPTVRQLISWPRVIKAAVEPRLDRIFHLWLLECGIEEAGSAGVSACDVLID